MTLALPTKWIWDSWYVHDGDLWHGFFLQADKALRNPDLRHFNVTPGPRDQPGPEDLGAQGNDVRAGRGAGVGRLHHLDRLGGAGR